MADKPVLTREALLSGEIERLLRSDRVGLQRMSDEQRAELVELTLDALDDKAELWVFGYGSLIWNPTLDFEEQRRCTINGYEKKFCFWTTLGRGTDEHPGLMMGLVEGGHCNGLAYRINLKKAATELDILFRREMSFFVYKPVWVEAHCAKTNSTFNTLTFVVDPENERYVENLTLEETVRTIATAKGPLGRNCDYLFQLSDKLRELNFEETELDELVGRVREFQNLNFEPYP